jgi:hypothetical protein
MTENHLPTLVTEYLTAHPGASLPSLIDAVYGRSLVSVTDVLAICKSARMYGYGAASNGLWYLMADNKEVEEALLKRDRAPGTAAVIQMLREQRSIGVERIDFARGESASTIEQSEVTRRGAAQGAGKSTQLLARLSALLSPYGREEARLSQGEPENPRGHRVIREEGQDRTRTVRRIVLSESGDAWEPLWDGNLGILASTGDGGSLLLGEIVAQASEAGGICHSIEAKALTSTTVEQAGTIAEVSSILYDRYKQIEHTRTGSFQTVLLVINDLSLLHQQLKPAPSLDTEDTLDTFGLARGQLEDIFLLGNRVGIYVVAKDAKQECLWWDFPSVVGFKAPGIVTTLCTKLRIGHFTFTQALQEVNP